MSLVESMWNSIVEAGVLKFIIYMVLLALIVRYTPLLIKKINEQIMLKRMAKFGMDYIDKMDGFQFEMYLKALFKKLGYQPIVTSKTGDYGADLVLKGKNKIVIQAKRYSQKNKVGISAVQEILGGKEYYKANEAWVITTSTFTPQAKKLADSSKVKLLDREELQKFINEINPESTAENNLAKTVLKEVESEPKKCPRCGNDLVVRVSRKSGAKFMGCSTFPACRYTETVK